MKYIKDFNADIIGVIIIFLILYTISGAIFLDVIPTGIELDVHRFNLKTLSVMGLIFSGLAIWGLTKVMDNSFYGDFY